MGVIKTKEEIEKLINASRLADDCFDYVCKTIKIGMTECDVADCIDNFFMANGADALAFETIVGSGVNSSMIHSTPSNRRIEFGDIILLDFGCVLGGYCSDISRTIFVGKVEKKYLDIYEIVLKAQQAAIKGAKAGMSGSKIDSIARDIINDKGYDFKHTVGHGVGTIVHEDPKISQKSEDIILDNMVFTIEPGIYLEGECGVRIEDTVVMENGKITPLNKSKKDIIVI